MPKVVIGCRLPNGLIIRHPNPQFNAEVKLNGLHSSKLIARDGSPAASYVTTEVDQELWDAWKIAYRDFAALKNGSIFEAKSLTDAAAQGKERSKEKFGFEPMPQKALGITAAPKGA